MAYKWFCGLNLNEKAPDATTISQNRRRRFPDDDIAEKLFGGILRQYIVKGFVFVAGKVTYTDSVHVKAKATKHKKRTVTVEIMPKEYVRELDAPIDAGTGAMGKGSVPRALNEI